MLKFSYNYNKYNKLYFHFSGTFFFYTFFLITALKTKKSLTLCDKDVNKTYLTCT